MHVNVTGNDKGFLNHELLYHCHRLFLWLWPVVRQNVPSLSNTVNSIFPCYNLNPLILRVSLLYMQDLLFVTLFSS